MTVLPSPPGCDGRAALQVVDCDTNVVALFQLGEVAGIVYRRQIGLTRPASHHTGRESYDRFLGYALPRRERVAKRVKVNGNIAGPKPGDVLSFEDSTVAAPVLGARMTTMLTFPRESPDQPSKADFLPSDTGAWEVVYVKQLASKLGKVRVYVRAL